jgi:hypothetical protein
MARHLAKTALIAAFMFAAGCIGDRAADRNLSLYQLQSTQTYSGQFMIDTTKLPANAVVRTESTDHWGNPVISLTIRQDCPVKVLVVPATQP